MYIATALRTEAHRTVDSVEGQTKRTNACSMKMVSAMEDAVATTLPTAPEKRRESYGTTYYGTTHYGTTYYGTTY